MAPATAVPIRTGFAVALNVLPGPVVLLEEVLRVSEVGLEPMGALQLVLDVRDLLDQGELVHGLGVVRDRPVGVDRDRHRPHAQEPERHEPEGEDRRRDHEGCQAHHAHPVRGPQEDHHGEPEPVGAEVARDEAGQDRQGGATLPGRRHDLADVPGFRRGEHLDELGDDGTREGPAGDDGRELPPQGRVAAQVGDEDVARDVGEGHRDDRGQPHEGGQRRLEVHLVGVPVAGARDRVVDQVRPAARQDHDDAHHEDPDEELDLDLRVLDREEDEGDQRDARHAVGLEPVGAGSDRVSRVVARAIGDDAGVPGVVLLDVEDDLHEIRADVRDLREDAARDPEGGGAQRLADREPDEARARVVARDEEEDAQHHEQLDADQQHPDAHPGPQRDLVEGKRLAAQARERRAGVRVRVDPDAEPRDPVAPRDSDQAEQQDHRDLQRLEVPQEAEVQDHDHADERLEEQQELALLDEVGLAGLVDQVRDLRHRPVHREPLDRRHLEEPEGQPRDAHEEADQEQRMAADSQELGRVEVGEDQVGLAAAGGPGRAGRGRRRGQQEDRDRRRGEKERASARGRGA